jgi:hypothetical protein
MFAKSASKDRVEDELMQRTVVFSLPEHGWMRRVPFTIVRPGGPSVA